MSAAAAGALLLAVAVVCAMCVPLGVQQFPRLGRHPDAIALGEAGWRYGLARWEALRCVSLVAAVLACLALSVTPLLGVAAPLIQSIVVRSRAARARGRARAATTHLLRSTEAALRSGASLPEALRRATDASDDALANRPFAEALRAFDLRASLDDALRDSSRLAVDAATRCAVETLAIGVGARLSYERTSVLVAAAADRLAFEDRLADEVRARTAGLRGQIVLLALVVPALGTYLALTVSSLAETLATPLGRFVLIPLAVGLEIAGIVVSRRAIGGAGR